MKVYSYIRLSSLEQRFGHGENRQAQLAEEYCRKHGLELDKEFNLSDIGISGFRSANSTEGKLSLFLEAIRQNKIPAGSLLIVESLDRISRDQVLVALGVFSQIVQSGITIVTLADNRTYTKESIQDIGNLLYSIIIMSRSHEESLTKSHRLKAVWSKKRQDAAEGKAVTKRIPAWLRKDGDKFIVVEERAELIQKIFHMSLTMGQNLITGWLNQNKIPTWGDGEKGSRKSDGWRASYIKKLQNDDKVLGWYSPGIMQSGKRVLQEPIKGYYPQIISEERYREVQVAISSRYHKSGRIGESVNIWQGLLFCTCGASLIRVNRGNNEKVKLYCNHYRRKMSDCSGSVRFDILQEKLLDYMMYLNIPELMKSLNINHDEMKKQLDSMIAERDSEQAKLKSYAAGLAHGHVDFLVGLMQETEAKLKVLNKDIDKLTKTVDELDYRYQSIPSLAFIFQGLFWQNPEKKALLAIKTQLRDIIEKIVVDVSNSKFKVTLKR